MQYTHWQKPRCCKSQHRERSSDGISMDQDYLFQYKEDQHGHNPVMSSTLRNKSEENENDDFYNSP
ncbi:hypothetical protein DPMN_172290 [Dreissena polymorpha]|uniref:Uncharacterized protein n=1 Tax=Dreissena polymorpha TaxID=45954 RepID=A0A9D4E228_DREPO|nr:hypothetical protein DPMN_171822 [Dreissena polymorpha]KAH3770610.1 hypothetical protein DPMN_171899 [Dreissena polymorpha]KAH3770712.1 hypothetical protein DPMN_172005 [Dreissena polymorpha]KAH3770990.1 hypothetical protein DPMN_172290 [Dreissena polymorpha]